MLQMCAAKCVSLGLPRLLTAGAVALAALRFSDPCLNSPQSCPRRWWRGYGRGVASDPEIAGLTAPAGGSDDHGHASGIVSASEPRSGVCDSAWPDRAPAVPVPAPRVAHGVARRRARQARGTDGGPIRY